MSGSRAPCTRTDLQEAQAGSIRLKLMKVGTRMMQSVRRIVLHLSGVYPLRELFTRLARKRSPCRRFPSAPPPP